MQLISNSRTPRKHAFSLVELLVVMAITAVLIALLISAVVKVRERSNCAVCASNLRQIALAAAGYQDQHGRLPPNFHEDPSRTDGSHNLFYGPILPLLPYLEQDSTYRNFSFLYYDSPFPDPDGNGWPNPGGSGMTWENHTWSSNPFNFPPTNRSVPYMPPPNPLACPNPTGRTNVPGQTWGGEGSFRLFQCPSHPANHMDIDRGTAYLTVLYGRPTIDMPRGNPLANNLKYSPFCLDDPPGQGCFQTVIGYPPAPYLIGRSDYVAVVGAFTIPGVSPTLAQKYRSLFNYPITAGLANVPDGTSNTLLFSEFCGLYWADDPFGTTDPFSPQIRGWWSSSWASNGVSVIYGTCPDQNNAQPDIDLPPGELTHQCNYGRTGAGLGSGATLGGWHPGSFNAAFADGSVRSLRLGLDKSILFALAGYNDGDQINPDGF
jgi:prepilin-type N-terminal cleavage/methylation domain-containing protein/prepilin-type processing-associated H-X9-DG protein